MRVRINLMFLKRTTNGRPYKLTATGFSAAVRAEIGITFPAAGAFPRFYGSFCTAVGTEFSIVFFSAGTEPFVSVPFAGCFLLGSHAEKLCAVGHVLKSHNGETINKHILHLNIGRKWL